LRLERHVLRRRRRASTRKEQTGAEAATREARHASRLFSDRVRRRKGRLRRRHSLPPVRAGRIGGAGLPDPTRELEGQDGWRPVRHPSEGRPSDPLPHPRATVLGKPATALSRARSSARGVCRRSLRSAFARIGERPTRAPDRGRAVARARKRGWSVHRQRAVVPGPRDEIPGTAHGSGRRAAVRQRRSNRGGQAYVDGDLASARSRVD